MGKIIVFIISLLALIASPRLVEGDTATIPFYIHNAATKYGIDTQLMYAICKVESNCKSKAMNNNDGTSAQRSKGIKSKSYGMFQIKSLIAKNLGYKDHPSKLLNPEINALYAAKLLKHLYKRYNNTAMVISAYNAGRYTKSNSSYVNKVLLNYAKIKIDKKF